MKNRQIVAIVKDKKSGKDYICLLDLLLMLYRELTTCNEGSETYNYIKDLIRRLENMKDVKGK